MRFLAKIENNELKFWRPQQFKDYLKTLKGEIDIIIEKHQDIRTTQQNRFYWLYLGIIEDETGDNSNDLHEYFKRVLLPPRFAKVQGKEIKLPASTTKLNKQEMTVYLEKICAMTGVPIPPSNF